MEPKVSIIVPIYNVESYLRRCLDSLLSQSLIEIEIIAVNDGSTDSSLEILKDYSEKDKRIVLINKENGGVSSARNEGLLATKGQYIGFVDPDDWIDKEMYEQLYNTAIQEKADIVMCTYIREYGTHSKEKKFNMPQKVCYQNDKVKQEVMRRLVGPMKEEIANPELLDAWGTVWSKLYRAEMIKENKITFIDLNVIGTNEDSLFNIHTFYYTNTFIFLNTPFYHYWKANETSVTAGYKPNLKDQWFKLYSMIECFLNDKNMQHDFYLALNNRICLNTLGLGLNIISKSNKSSVWMKISKLSSILSDNRIKRSFQQFEMTNFPIVWRAFYFCAKSRFATVFYLMLITMNWLRKMIK